MGYFFLSGVIAQIAVARRRGGEPPTLREVARDFPWRNLLIVVDLIVSSGTAIGLQLLVVPGLVFATWFGLAAVLVETRHLGPRAALERSRELVRGRFWIVFTLLAGTLALVTGLAYPLETVVGAILPWASQVEYAIAALIAGVIVKPFSAVVTVELAIELDEATPGLPATSPARAAGGGA